MRNYMTIILYAMTYIFNAIKTDLFNEGNDNRDFILVTLDYLNVCFTKCDCAQFWWLTVGVRAEQSLV